MGVSRAIFPMRINSFAVLGQENEIFGNFSETLSKLVLLDHSHSL